MSRRIVVKVGGAILDDAEARSRFAAAVDMVSELTRLPPIGRAKARMTL